MHLKAENHLKKVDKKLKALINCVGPCTLNPQQRMTPYQSLIRAVVFQQLHGKAAQTILDRFIALFPKRRFPKPEEVLSVSPTAMRKAGLSKAKSLAIKDIAKKTIDGVVPTSKAIRKLSDEEIIERLTSIRGVGLWTVQMMLIFKLGRLDVMPASDYGVQKGFSLTFRKPHPKPKELLESTEHWSPYRSIGAWYMWRAVDLASKKLK